MLCCVVSESVSLHCILIAFKVQKASTEESSNQENIEANIQAVETLQEEIIKELVKEPEKEPVQLDSDRIVSKRAYH